MYCDNSLCKWHNLCITSYFFYQINFHVFNWENATREQELYCNGNGEKKNWNVAMEQNIMQWSTKANNIERKKSFSALRNSQLKTWKKITGLKNATSVREFFTLLTKDEIKKVCKQIFNYRYRSIYLLWFMSYFKQLIELIFIQLYRPHLNQIHGMKNSFKQSTCQI